MTSETLSHQNDLWYLSLFITSTKKQQIPKIQSSKKYFHQLQTPFANVENSFDYQETIEIPPLQSFTVAQACPTKVAIRFARNQKMSRNQNVKKSETLSVSSKTAMNS